MYALVGSALALVLAPAAMAQIAVLQVKVVEGEGAVHIAGTRATRPLVVEITARPGNLWVTGGLSAGIE